MYTIEIDYTTGDSLSSERRQETIGLVWKDKQLAREALANIKEHYKIYLDSEEYDANQDDILKSLKCKKWYINLREDDKYYWKYIIACKLDDGSYRNVNSSMWIGYFEELHGAKVTTMCDNEDSFTFKENL